MRAGLFAVLLAALCAGAALARVEWYGADEPIVVHDFTSHDAPCNCTEAREIKTGLHLILAQYKTTVTVVDQLTDGLGKCMELHEQRDDLDAWKYGLIALLLVFCICLVGLLSQERNVAAPTAPPAHRD